MGDGDGGLVGAPLLGKLRTGAPQAAHGHVPTGVAVFPKEIVTPVRQWMEASYTNIRHWSEMPKGGHFAAFEQPELFVGEVRDFFRTLRQRSRISSRGRCP